MTSDSRLELNRRTVDRFTAACKADPRIVAAFLGGSFAAGTADEQSDIDVYVVTGREDYEAFFEDREKFLRSWGELAWWRDIRNFEGLGFDMLLFVMEDGVDGEVALAHEANFRGTHGGPHVVLVDKAGLLEGVKFPLLGWDDLINRDEVEKTLAEFWLETRTALKAWARGHWWEAAEWLGALRKRDRTLARLFKAEGWEERLTETYVPLDRDRIAQGIRIAVQAFLDWGPVAAKKAGVTFPTEHARLGARRVNDTLGPAREGTA